MLPAKGYLKSINCPFFETCICERPYCHYKHNKKDVNARNTELISEIVSKAVHKVLQENTSNFSGATFNSSATFNRPAFNSGAFNSGIFNSCATYNSSAAFNRSTTFNSSTTTSNSSNSSNITYNPTPIAQLNKYKSENYVQIKKHIPIQYTPEQPRSLRKIQFDYAPSSIHEDTSKEELDENISDGEDSDESTLDQCKRIFEEYEAPASTSLTQKPIKPDSPPLTQKPIKPDSPPPVVAKKRISYETSTKTEKDVIKRTSIKNPAHVMADRYKLKSKRSPDQNDCPKSKRIASVPNVSALLDAKKSIDLMIKKSGQLTRVKRIAHVPDVCLTDVPTVLQAEKSKLPVNIRSRFLYLIIKECVKLHSNKQVAYERALNEEFNCYVKCSAINSYKNAIMLLINRLRKETNGTPNQIVTDRVFEFDEAKLYEHFRKWLLSEDELYENGFPRLGALRKGHALFKNKSFEKIPDGCQQCARCRKLFKIKDDGYPVNQEDCIYHPSNRVVMKGEAKYACCQQISLRKGCCISGSHVFEITNPDKLTGFVCTFDPGNSDPRSGKVFALDCEMVYTTRGLELARVTIIDGKCNVCFESLVKPIGEILDCNTRFSGITADVLQNVKTKITDVQATLLLMFNSRTILVGHSLESDLKALRLIHSCVIDTSVLFPHKMGPPKKRALRTLASDFLKKIIQNDEGGHDSAEDAVTCMELLIWKMKEELKTK